MQDSTFDPFAPMGEEAPVQDETKGKKAKPELTPEEKEAQKKERERKAAEKFEKDFNLLLACNQIKSEETRETILVSLQDRFKPTRKQWDEWVEKAIFEKDFADVCISDYGMLKTFTSKPGARKGISTICGFVSLKRDCVDENGNITNPELAAAGLALATEVEKFREREDIKALFAKLEESGYYWMDYMRYWVEEEKEEKNEAAPTA